MHLLFCSMSLLHRRRRTFVKGQADASFDYATRVLCGAPSFIYSSRLASLFLILSLSIFQASLLNHPTLSGVA